MLFSEFNTLIIRETQMFLVAVIGYGFLETELLI